MDIDDTGRSVGSKGVIRQLAESLWEDLPGHFDGALSKMLVRPEVCGAQHLDFRLSSYQPKGYVAPHTHKVQEQIYHVLEGDGLMELAGKRSVVGPGTTIFVPPGVEHAIYNTGVRDLVFFVITSPPEDD